MVGYLVLGVALAIGLTLILRGLRGATASQAMRWIWQSIAAVSVVVGIYFLATGRPNYALVPAFGVLVGLLGWLIDAALRPRKPNTSRVNTRFLRLTLDHRTGQVTGDIVDGPFLHRRIESLRVDELVDLFVYYKREDEPSARLIEAYLDRTSPTWRARYGPDGAPKQDAYTASGAGGPMSKSEALRLLGLQLGATADEVRAAHRRKLQEHHPDRGGDPDMAARINQARDVLLEG
ncbi:MAG TPA: hypothetical protein VIF14_02110 [Alphaproteobacteria bacterium]|jgi:hypothetical protein